jgi:uroporphyrinogen decarboxylase
MKASAGNEVPIIGVVMSPFSLPVMQLGFENYLSLMHERLDLFARLMKINEEFCVEWANAQLAAGATAICYFDPVSSPTIVPPTMFMKTGFPIAKRTISRFNGPAAIHMASGACLPILDRITELGMAAVAVSSTEDLAEIKASASGKVTVLGNLNGIEMRRWTSSEAEAAVKQAISKAGPSGGFILSDNHGEIPWQVPDEVLSAISESVHRWGRYPLTHA